MAVPVEITAMRVRAIGEPWDRVGFKLTPGHDEEGKLEDAGSRNASFPDPGLPGRP